MKLLILILLNSLLMVNVYSQRFKGTDKEKLEEMDEQYSTGQKMDYFDYAWLLYNTNEKSTYPKADTVLNHVISEQDVDPESITYGQWGWRKPDGEKIAGPGDIPWYVDFNRALFAADKMFVKLWEQQNKMSKGRKRKLYILLQTFSRSCCSPLGLRGL